MSLRSGEARATEHFKFDACRHGPRVKDAPRVAMEVDFNIRSLIFELRSRTQLAETDQGLLAAERANMSLTSFLNQQDRAQDYTTCTLPAFRSDRIVVCVRSRACCKYPEAFGSQMHIFLDFRVDELSLHLRWSSLRKSQLSWLSLGANLVS